MTSRRQFVRIVPIAAASLLVGRAQAQAALPPLSEKDPQAVALGYVSDTTKADMAKYKNHTPAQMCGNCQLYQGKPGDASGPCPLFAGKAVAAKGWCSAYVKKP